MVAKRTFALAGTANRLTKNSCLRPRGPSRTVLQFIAGGALQLFLGECAPNTGAGRSNNIFFCNFLPPLRFFFVLQKITVASVAFFFPQSPLILQEHFEWPSQRSFECEAEGL